tara:strand:+ start:681 stop:1019 length:339 start_codon:yes stop_codon:yes gene_type:complete
LLPLLTAHCRKSLYTGKALLLGLLGSRQLLCAQVSLSLTNATELARNVSFRSGKVREERGEALLLLRRRLLPSLLLLESLLLGRGAKLGLGLLPSLPILEGLLSELGAELRF